MSVITEYKLEMMKYADALKSTGELFISLDEKCFGELKNTEDCFEIKNQGLAGKILNIESVLSKFQPAHVRMGRADFYSTINVVVEHGSCMIQLIPVTGLPVMDAEFESAIVSFLEFGSSYCFRSSILGFGREDVFLEYPSQIMLRRRRRFVRILPVNPLVAKIVLADHEVSGEVMNLNEQGCCIRFRAEEAGVREIDGIREVELKLSTGAVRANALAKWFREVGETAYTGIEFSSFEKPVRLRLAERRRMERHRMEPPVECIMETDKGVIYKGSIIDLNENGAGILTGSCPISSGDWLTGIYFEVDGFLLQASAKVMWVRKDTQTQNIGLRFMSMNRDCYELLFNYLFCFKIPELEFVRSKDMDEVVSLYEQVNYLGETGKGEKAHNILDCAKQVWDVILEKGRNIGYMACVKENGRIIGTVASNRVYSCTWLAHSNAAVRGNTVLPAEHLRFGYLDLTEMELNAEYLMIYFLGAKSYSERYYKRAIEMSQNRENHFQLSMNVINYDLGCVPEQSSASFDTGIADKTEEREFIALMHRLYPELYLHAVDLWKEPVSLVELTKEYETIGLVRDRKLLCLRDRGRVKYFALLEITSPGLTLNGCTDGFMIYSSNPDSEESPDMKKSLIVSCLNFYKNLGRKEINYFTQDKNAGLYLFDKAMFVQDLFIWITPKETTMELRRYFQQIYGFYKLSKLGLYKPEPGSINI